MTFRLLEKLKIFFSAIAAIFLFFSPIGSSQHLLARAATNDAERKALEEQLAKVEAEIEQHQATIEQYRAQGKNLKDEIKRLNAKIAKLDLQIQAINISLKKLDEEITDTEGKIQVTEARLDLNRSALREAIQNIYENDSQNLVAVLLKNPRLSTFFADVNGLLAVQDSIRVTVEKISQLHNQLVDQKDDLSLERSDATALKSYQVSQKGSLRDTRVEKDDILKITKGQEERYKSLLAESKKTAAQIRSKIFELLGGGELSFDEAYKFAKLAEGATGVRAALILAVLDRESALGQNVGRCSYRTAMNPNRDAPLFLDLVRVLNINPDSVTVSCANRDGFYGGAMGPAQFIPYTWNLYKDRIAEITANNPASPWRNADAFVGTALYLRDSGAAHAGLAGEREAAARYYSGSRWRRYLWTYGDRVVTRAQQFQQDIDVLNS